MASYRAWRKSLDPVLQVLFLARFGLLMSLTVCALIAIPPQAVDAMRVLAEDASRQWWRPIYLFFAALLVCLYLWGSIRVVFRIRLRPPAEREPFVLHVSRHLPRLVGALPLLAIALVCVRARITVQNAGATTPNTMLWLFTGTALLAAIAFYSTLIVEERRLDPKFVRLAKFGLLASTPLAVAAFLVFTFASETARHLGPMTIVLLAAVVWITFGTLLAYLGTVLRLPLVLFVLLLAVVWSVLDWNDNHALRHLSVDSSSPLPDISIEFARWLDKRADANEYESYPVFIVSAEGGGLYAAYFTAMVLSSLQDENPAFARHVFAISAVSGGSLGAAVFAGIASQEAHNQIHVSDQKGERFQDVADRILSRDFLSPLLAAGLFPDTLQRFVPFPMQVASRARALERGFESAWTAEAQMHPTWNDQLFSDAFYELWTDFASGATPALLLNTTEVETGQRMVICNLRPDDRLYSESPNRTEGNAAIRTLAEVALDANPPLSTAVGLSARFPFITPAGYLMTKPESAPATESGRRKQRFVDGGYFDNSGAATLADVLIAMHFVDHDQDQAQSSVDHDQDQEQRFVAIWIHIGFIDETPRNRRGGPLHKRQGMGEIMSPLRALTNATSGRTGTSVRQLRIMAKQFEEHGGDMRSVEFVLTLDASGPPLGWLLSEVSRKKMKDQLAGSKNSKSTDKVLDFLKLPARVTSSSTQATSK